VGHRDMKTTERYIRANRLTKEYFNLSTNWPQIDIGRAVTRSGEYLAPVGDMDEVIEVLKIITGPLHKAVQLAYLPLKAP
jgi:hypothetical protein